MSIIDKFKLDGKIALITGSSRGLGKVCAKGLAEAGATVVINSLTMEGSEKVANEIIADGGKANANFELALK